MDVPEQTAPRSLADEEEQKYEPPLSWSQLEVDTMAAATTAYRQKQTSEPQDVDLQKLLEDVTEKFNLPPGNLAMIRQSIPVGKVCTAEEIRQQVVALKEKAKLMRSWRTGDAFEFAVEIMTLQLHCPAPRPNLFGSFATRPPSLHDTTISGDPSTAPGTTRSSLACGSMEHLLAGALRQDLGTSGSLGDGPVLVGNSRRSDKDLGTSGSLGDGPVLLEPPALQPWPQRLLQKELPPKPQDPVQSWDGPKWHHSSRSEPINRYGRRANQTDGSAAGSLLLSTPPSVMSPSPCAGQLLHHPSPSQRERPVTAGTLQLNTPAGSGTEQTSDFKMTAWLLRIASLPLQFAVRRTIDPILRSEPPRLQPEHRSEASSSLLPGPIKSETTLFSMGREPSMADYKGFAVTGRPRTIAMNPGECKGLIVLARRYMPHKAKACRCIAWEPMAVMQQLDALAKEIGIETQSSVRASDGSLISPVVECTPSLDCSFVEPVLVEFPLSHCDDRHGFQVVVQEDKSAGFLPVPEKDWTVYGGSIWVRRHHFCQLGIKSNQVNRDSENEYTLHIFSKRKTEGRFEISVNVHLAHCPHCKQRFQNKWLALKGDGWDCEATLGSTLKAADNALLTITTKDAQGFEVRQDLLLCLHTEDPDLLEKKFEVQAGSIFTLEKRPSRSAEVDLHIKWPFTASLANRGMVLQGPPSTTYKNPREVSVTTQRTDGMQILFQRNFEGLAENVKFFDDLDIASTLSKINPAWVLLNTHSSSVVLQPGDDGAGGPPLHIVSHFGCMAYSSTSGTGAAVPWERLEQAFKQHIQTPESKLKLLVLVCCHGYKLASALQKLGVDVIAWVDEPEAGTAHQFALGTIKQYMLTGDLEDAFSHGERSLQDYLNKVDRTIEGWSEAERKSKTVTLFHRQPRLLVLCPAPSEHDAASKERWARVAEWECAIGDASAWHSLSGALLTNSQACRRVEFLCVCSAAYLMGDMDALRRRLPNLKVVIFTQDGELVRAAVERELGSLGILVLPLADDVFREGGDWTYTSQILCMLLRRVPGSTYMEIAAEARLWEEEYGRRLGRVPPAARVHREQLLQRPPDYRWPLPDTPSNLPNCRTQ